MQLIKKLVKNQFFICGSIISLILIILVYLLYFTDLFLLKEIVVVGNNKISKEEIIKLTELKGGERLYRISLSKIREKLLKHPRIEEVLVARNFLGILEIKIKEKEPLAILIKDNKGFLVNKKGDIISEILPEDYLFYPVVEIKNEEFKENFFNFLNWLKNNKSYLPVYESFAKVILDNESILFITKNNIKIYFPLITEKDWQFLYKSLDKVVTYLYEKQLMDKIEVIRMDYPWGKALIKFRS